MTRRNFLKRILQTGLAVLVGGWALAQRGVKKFVRAAVSKNYPGRIKALSNIENISKWSG